MLVKKDHVCATQYHIGKMSKKDCRKNCARKGYQMFSSEKTRICIDQNKENCHCHCGDAGCQHQPNMNYNLFEITDGR